MKLKVFYASDGDCLLLTSGDGHHALVDGGRGTSFREQTWPVLQTIAADNEALDLVVVSHIDADHISGILWLIQTVADWAVYDYQTTDGGNPRFPKPVEVRPPRISKLWHNSWRAQLGDLAGPVQALATQVADSLEMTSFDGSKAPEATADMFEAIENLVESIPDAIELRHLVDDETPIPRNTPFSDLVLLKNPPYVEKLGRTKLTVIGPATKHLERLREEWREWITRSPVAARTVDETLGAGAADQGAAATSGEAIGQDTPAELLSSLAAAAEVIVTTDPSKVTPPNRASIILLAEEGKRACLLTGDAAEEEILEGLDAAGRFDDGLFRCNVLKVQHHGSEHNLGQDFARRVIADHYVFSADGAHGNPDPSVVKTIVEERPGSTPFTFWFNCDPDRTLASRREAMRAAISEATSGSKDHPGLKVEILDGDKAFAEITV